LVIAPSVVWLTICSRSLRLRRRTANSLKAIPLFSFLQRKHVGPLEQVDCLLLIPFLLSLLLPRPGWRAVCFFVCVAGWPVICLATAQNGRLHPSFVH
jgi:hypothetical protein